MKKIKFAITGCLGRMGQQLIKSSRNNKDFKLVSLTESKKISKKIAGIQLELNTVNAFKKANVIIDFTVPKCTLQVLKIASKLKFLFVFEVLMSCWPILPIQPVIAKLIFFINIQDL